MNESVQIGDSFRARAVITASGPKRHIMFVIAESENELLVVPMDTFPEDCTNLIYLKQAQEFILNVNDYGYKEIKHKSFVNYGKADIISKRGVEILIFNAEIDVLESVSDDFLWDLIDNGLKSMFLKKKFKQFLKDYPWT